MRVYTVTREGFGSTMKFRQFCEKKKDLSESRHYMRHSVERGVQFPIPQPVMNALNLVPSGLHARMLHWIFTEGLRTALVQRRKVAKDVSKILSKKMGQEIEVPQDGLFAEEALKEIPGLAELIDGLEKNWMSIHEPDVIQLAGSESGANKVTRISLKEINSILIEKGLTPLYFGGRNGLIEYIEKGDWKIARGDIPTHANPVFEKHGINLALDDGYNGLKEDEKGNKVYSFGLDPSHGIKRDTQGRSTGEVISMAAPASEGKWKIYQTEPPMPEELQSIDYFKNYNPNSGDYDDGFEEVYDWIKQNHKSLKSVTMVQPGENKKFLQEEPGVWREPKASSHTGSYQVPNTQANWARIIEDSRNASLTALERVVKGLEQGMSLEDLKMAESETLQSLLADGSLTRDSFTSEKAMLRDAMRIAGSRSGIKTAAGTDEDWLAAKAIVKQNLMASMRRPGNINPTNGKRQDVPHVWALGDAEGLDRASIKVNGRQAIDLSRHLSSGIGDKIVKYEGFHGGIDFGSREFIELERQMGTDINAKNEAGEKLRELVADALVDLIFNDEDRTVASTSKVKRGKKGDAAGRTLQTSEMMGVSGMSHESFHELSKTTPINGGLLDVLKKGWFVSNVKNNKPPEGIKTIKARHLNSRKSMSKSGNLLYFYNSESKKLEEAYVKDFDSDEYYPVSNLEKKNNSTNNLILKKKDEELSLRKRKGGSWEIVDQSPIDVNFNGEKVQVDSKTLFNHMLNADENTFKYEGPEVETMVPVSTSEFDVKSHQDSGWKIVHPKGIESFDEVPENITKIKVALSGVKKKILIRKSSEDPWQEAIPKSETATSEDEIQDLIDNGWKAQYTDKAETILKLTDPEDPNSELIFKRNYIEEPEEGENHHQWFYLGTPKKSVKENPHVTGFGLKANTGQGITDRIGGTDKETQEMMNNFFNSVHSAAKNGEESEFGSEEGVETYRGKLYPSSLVKGIYAAGKSVLSKGAEEDLAGWGMSGQQKYIGDIRFKYGQPKPRRKGDPHWELGSFLKDEAGVDGSDVKKIHEFYIDQLFRKRKKANVYDGQSALVSKELGKKGEFLFGVDENDDPVFSKGIYDAIMHHGFKFRKRAAQNEIINQAKAAGFYKEKGQGSSGDEDEKKHDIVDKGVDLWHSNAEEDDVKDDEDFDIDSDEESEESEEDRRQAAFDHEEEAGGTLDADERIGQEIDDRHDTDLDDLNFDEPENLDTHGGQVDQPDGEPSQDIRRIRQRNLSNLGKVNIQGTLGNMPSRSFGRRRDDQLSKLPIDTIQPQPLVQKMKVESRDGFRRWLMETGPYDPKISKQKDRTFNVWGSPPEGSVPQKSIDGEIKTVQEDPTGSKGVKNGRWKKA